MKTDWQCPHCNMWMIIEGHDASSLKIATNSEKMVSIVCTSQVCHNVRCQRATTYVYLRKLVPERGIDREKTVYAIRLHPRGAPRAFPSYIPPQILEDYREARAIVELSPKASATLSRRCLQGIIRDFYEVTEANLAAAIKSIDGRMDPLVWAGIDAIRRVGNIGAHMEKDVDLIIEIEPEEAQLLIKLIEGLLHDLYVSRHEKQAQLEALVALAKRKDAERKGEPIIDPLEDAPVDLVTSLLRAEKAPEPSSD